MCVDSNHHQCCKTKLSKVLALDKRLLFLAEFIHAMKTPIHHGNKASHVYSHCKHMVCHSAPLWSTTPGITTASRGQCCVWSCSLMSCIMAQYASSASLPRWKTGRNDWQTTGLPQPEWPGEEEEMGSQRLHEVQQAEVKRSCYWGGATPGSSTCWHHLSGKQLCRKGPGNRKLNMSHHLDCCVQFCAFQCKRSMDILHTVQWRATKMKEPEDC